MKFFDNLKAALTHETFCDARIESELSNKAAQEHMDIAERTNS